MPLTCGKVFYFSLPHAWDRPSHPKIVFASEDGIVAFVHVTKDKAVVERHCKRVENKRKEEDLRTMVHVPAGCCAELAAEGWIDCSQATSEEEVLLLAERTFGRTSSCVPPALLAQIRTGVASSPLVADKVRTMARSTLVQNAKQTASKAAVPSGPTGANR